MKFGFFDDEQKEYVITRPDTPYPWINYLGSQDFFSLFSNTSGGYCFYKDARMLRLTRYRYNNVPTDAGGRYFYIKDGDTVWNPGWAPTQTPLDSYECRHGLGYSILSGKKDGISVQQTSFVPLNDPCEVHNLRLYNEGTKEKTVTLFSFVEFCLWNAFDDMTNFQRNYSTGEVEVCGSEIYHKTEYRERRNHYAVFSVNAPISSFDTDREAFIGQYGNFSSPKAVANGTCSNSMASGWAPVGAHCITVTLKPGEEKNYNFVLGYCENPQKEKWEAPNVINKTPAHRLIEKYKTEQQVQEALQALKEHWKTLLSTYKLQSNDEKLNRMVNIWNQYQCMVTFNLSRSASYFESGIGRGMGFRDSTQDLLGFVHLIPDRARERILDIAATQKADGSAYHQYQPLTKQGNSDIGSGFNDDPLWLIFGVDAYLKESGDWTILDEPVTFDCGKEGTAPLWEHLKRSFHYTLEHLGPHKLPLIGRADWNDCLNLNCFSNQPGESFQTCSNFESGIAESIFIAGLFAAVAPAYTEIFRRNGMESEAVLAERACSSMHEAVLNYGWDGEWFLRAYDAFGNKVGSQECEEGQIFIEPQGFCVMAKIGVKEGLAQKALDSVKTRLDTEFGIVLHAPSYTHYYENLGEISSYPPGYKENGGIFCHNNPWVSIAETVLGRGDRAFEIYRKTCPAYLEDISDVHRTEPYVYSQMIAGRDAPNFGQAKNSWLTGTAAWTFFNVSQSILGIRPQFDGLEVDPCIPSTLKEFTVTRKFRGDTYRIKVENPNGSQKGIQSLELDGKSLLGNVIPVVKDRGIHQVLVKMI